MDTSSKYLKKKQGPGGGEEKVVEETVGGVLHWGRETTNKAALNFLREEIREAYGGRAPRVLDPFAGGGAIPLEAMRLGCEVTATDINPVAWFILKCTLEYPQALAGEKRPLPAFVRMDRDFMEAFFKAQGMKGAMLRTQLKKLGIEEAKPNTSGARQPSLNLEIEAHTLDADLAWHVRAWGWWVLREARRGLARYYPVYADWQPLQEAEAWRKNHGDQVRQMQFVPQDNDGTTAIDALNRKLSPDELADERQPRWVPKPAVAYLWARTVTCKHCRATIPLLKTRWLAKKDKKRVLLTVEPNADRTGVIFGIENDVALGGGNNAQRRENDRRVGQGTMSRSGAWCPCCGKPGTVSMTSEDLRAEGTSGRIDRQPIAVVVDGPAGKEYRLPTPLDLGSTWTNDLAVMESSVPHGLPTEPVPRGGSRQTGGSPFTVHLYGMTHWRDLFTERQLVALSVFLLASRRAQEEIAGLDYTPTWVEALSAYLGIAVDRLADYSSASCSWHNSGQKMGHTFARFALPILWDFAEVNTISETTGGYAGGTEWIARFVTHALHATDGAAAPSVRKRSAIQVEGEYDVIVTDPPYYDAIPYSDLMDFFYVWLRRSVGDLSPEIAEAMCDELGPKWDHSARDGELIDDPSRHGNDASASKDAYEAGMASAFSSCRKALRDDGRFVVVFANKQPNAWEALVGALIRSGFVVDGSWPIQTEMGQRTRALSSAALASSVWLVCRKRPAENRPGWDNRVLQEMRENIAEKLRDFWDAGIHGPDFVWAATGPALEAYSKHPIVKKANAPGETMSVGEFLSAVRRIVVEFVVGRVLSESAHISSDASGGVAASLDDVTTYYLLHRHDFGMNDAPAGACICTPCRATCPRASWPIATICCCALVASTRTKTAKPTREMPMPTVTRQKARAARSS